MTEHAPRMWGMSSAVYPPGETTRETVVVEVVVEADGSTSSLRVTSGSEPFATAALDAVRRYRFEPARRVGKPIRARIRLAVEFAPPDPVKVPVPVAPPPPAVPGQPATIEDEVDVWGSRNPVSSPTQQKLGRAEVRMIPGAYSGPSVLLAVHAEKAGRVITFDLTLSVYESGRRHHRSRARQQRAERDLLARQRHLRRALSLFMVVSSPYGVGVR